MVDPLRIQLRRTKGWRMPANTIIVSRPTVWGNMVRIGQPLAEIDPADGSMTKRKATAREVVQLYRAALAYALAINPVSVRDRLAPLHGRNLACWCRLCPVHAAGKPLGVRCPDCAPCHADVLLEVANGPLMCEAVDA